MPRLTNQDIHSEINLVKQDVVHIKTTQAKMQEDISMIKERLLNPDTGAIARVNQNTNFRKSAQRTLWSIWIALIGIIGKLIFWN